MSHISQMGIWENSVLERRYGLTIYSFIQRTAQFRSIQSLSRFRLFATPWTATHQASLSITNSWSLLKLTSIEPVMPSNHLILCRPLFLLSSIFRRNSYCDPTEESRDSWWQPLGLQF